MPRRKRRSGIRYIENDGDRSITFFKRRGGLFKSAADLSTLTGARTVIVVESENGKKSAFGTPSADPIIDSFILGNAPPLVDGQKRARIIRLQNDLFQLEKDKVVEDKRMKVSMARKKEIQETSRMAKHIYGDEKHLNVDELNELLHGLSLVQKDINDRLQELQPSYQLEIGGARDPSLRLSSSWSQHSQIQQPPRRLPWTPLGSSANLPWSSWLLPQSSRSQSSILNPIMLPSPQAPPTQLQRQAHMMPLPNESHQYNKNYNFSQSTLLYSQPPPPAPSSLSQIPLSNDFPPSSPPLQLPLHSQVEPPSGEQNLNPGAPLQNHSNTHNFTAGNPFANFQWSPIIPSNEPYNDPSLHGTNVYLGNNGYHGGLDAGGHDMPGPSGLHQQAYDYFGSI